MIYFSAIYANAENTMVTGTDVEGATETVSLDYTLFRQPDDGPQGFLANGGAIAPFQLPPVIEQPHKLYKSTLIRRLNEQEAVVLTGLLDASPIKSQMLWQASEWIGSDDPLFTDLKAAITGALGAARAAQILASEV